MQYNVSYQNESKLKSTAEENKNNCKNTGINGQPLKQPQIKYEITSLLQSLSRVQFFVTP